MEPNETRRKGQTTIEEYFGDLPDPRRGPAILHRLIDILTIALLGVVCGADDYEAIAEFGERRADWLKTFLALPNGIPSHDTFNRVFAMLKPDAFEARYLKWMQAVAPMKAGEHIALDGKVLRRSLDRYGGQEAIKMVSACAVERGLVLAQQAVPDDTNEISILPELLKLLALKDCIVTVDAANCQVENAQIILNQGGDFVFAVKGNQGNLQERIRQCFEELPGTPRSRHTVAFETREKGHGRQERRHYTVVNDPFCIDYINQDHRDWRIGSIIRVERERTWPHKTELNVSYYCSSLDGTDPHRLSRCIRNHWGIENGTHWVLDVTFKEDLSRIRTGFGPENFAALRHMALNLLKSEKSTRKSVAHKRFAAALDPDYLLKILQAGLSQP